MRIVARKALKDYWEDHPDAEEPLKAWFKETKGAKWETPADIKILYRHASILKNGRAVFNIAGNKYRLVVKINYAVGIVYVRFLGTHEEYDKIDAETV